MNLNPFQLIAKYPDKFQHVVAGAAIASLIATVTTPVVGFAAAVLAAAGKETLDVLSKHYTWAAKLHAFLFHKPTGDFEVWDFVWTVIAGAIAAGGMAWLNG